MDKNLTFLSPILAGMLIGIGDIAITKVDNRYVAAFLFSVALLSIIHFGIPLYTGRIGNIVHAHTTDDVLMLIMILVCNVTGTLIIAVMSINLGLWDAMVTIGTTKAEHTFAYLFSAGIACNILIHVAARAKNTAITILCIMTFILCGFEHSIADVAFLFLIDPLKWLVVLAGNTVGGVATEACLYLVEWED